jgi:hypothetical protein
MNGQIPIFERYHPKFVTGPIAEAAHAISFERVVQMEITIQERMAERIHGIYNSTVPVTDFDPVGRSCHVDMDAENSAVRASFNADCLKLIAHCRNLAQS